MSAHLQGVSKASFAITSSHKRLFDEESVDGHAQEKSSISKKLKSIPIDDGSVFFKLTEQLLTGLNQQLTGEDALASIRHLLKVKKSPKDAIYEFFLSTIDQLNESFPRELDHYFHHNMLKMETILCEAQEAFRSESDFYIASLTQLQEFLQRGYHTIPASTSSFYADALKEVDEWKKSLEKATEDALATGINYIQDHDPIGRLKQKIETAKEQIQEMRDKIAQILEKDLVQAFEKQQDTLIQKRQCLDISSQACHFYLTTVHQYSLLVSKSIDHLIRSTQEQLNTLLSAQDHYAAILKDQADVTLSLLENEVEKIQKIAASYEKMICDEYKPQEKSSNSASGASFAIPSGWQRNNLRAILQKLQESAIFLRDHKTLTRYLF
ncbi:MAG: hypothetical protein ACM3JI_03695 [Anaerolineae bacterium]